MLKLTARIIEKKALGGAVVGISINGVEFTVRPDPEHADQLVNLLNAATEALKACKELDAVTFLVTEMLNAHNLACPSALSAIAEQARGIVAKAKGAT